MNTTEYYGSNTGIAEWNRSVLKQITGLLNEYNGLIQEYCGKYYRNPEVTQLITRHLWIVEYHRRSVGNVTGTFYGQWNTPGIAYCKNEYNWNIQQFSKKFFSILWFTNKISWLEIGHTGLRIIALMYLGKT